MLLTSLMLSLAFAANSGAQDHPTPLFQKDDVLQLTMKVDFQELCRPSETVDCQYSPTTFQYQDASGQQIEVPVEIRRRDGWRAQQTNCQIPTLFVRFDPATTSGTVFEGQSTLALTSHCGKGISEQDETSPILPDQFESYVVSEYLGYRLYNLFTDASLRVRLARLHYAHPDNSRLDITHDAFFSEHFDDLARRLGGQIVAADGFSAESLDTKAANRLALFQFMVGNTDWSITELNNIALVRVDNQQDIPVVYDLDMSGLVNAFYAEPDSDLPISTVRDRYFMGYCDDMTHWNDLFAEFSGLRSQVMETLASTPRLGRGERRYAGVYIDSFFDLLRSSDSRQSNIVDACQPLPASDRVSLR